MADKNESPNEKLWHGIYLDKYFDVYNALKKGADVNLRTSYDYTPLMLAASKDHETIVGLLINSKADITLTSGGKTATDIAWAAESTKAFRVLAIEQIKQTGSPFWMKPNGLTSMRVLSVPSLGIVCEHFDFTDKMYTSMLLRTKDFSHTRTSFNNVARHLVAEARVHVPDLKAAPRSKFKPTVL